MRPSPPADVEKFRKFLRGGSPSPHAYVILLGINQIDYPGIIERIEKGLPYSAFERLLKNSALSTEQLLKLIQVPARTLARRKAAGRFSSDESDRLVRAARVYSRALHFFDGDWETASEWLSEEQWAFGGATPLEMARTEVGAQEVERLLSQLEYGVLP